LGERLGQVAGLQAIARRVQVLQDLRSHVAGQHVGHAAQRHPCAADVAGLPAVEQLHFQVHHVGLLVRRRDDPELAPDEERGGFTDLRALQLPLTADRLGLVELDHGDTRHPQQPLAQQLPARSLHVCVGVLDVPRHEVGHADDPADARLVLPANVTQPRHALPHQAFAIGSRIRQQLAPQADAVAAVAQIESQGIPARVFFHRQQHQALGPQGLPHLQPGGRGFGSQDRGQVDLSERFREQFALDQLQRRVRGECRTDQIGQAGGPHVLGGENPPAMQRRRRRGRRFGGDSGRGGERHRRDERRREHVP
jgi:hypothetical protein